MVVGREITGTFVKQILWDLVADWISGVSGDWTAVLFWGVIYLVKFPTET